MAAPTRYFGDFTIFHHSKFHQLKAWAAPIASTILAARAQAAARWAGALAQWPEFAAACARAAKMVEAIGAAHACNWWNLL